MEKKVFFLSKESAARLTDAELADKLFSGNYRVVGNSSHWAKDNPERYKAVRLIVQENGRIAKPLRDQIVEKYGPKEARRLSVQELKDRLRVSRSEDDKYYRKNSDGSKDNLRELQRDKPERYAQVKRAHDSYATEGDLIPQQNVQGRFEITGALATAFNLPAGYTMTADEYLELNKLKTEYDVEVTNAASGAKATVGAE